MGKSNKLSLLTKALPIALMMSGPASQALAFELSAARTIGNIGEALDRGWLHEAQDTLNQLRLCGVRAFRIGNDTLRLAILDQAITELASGDNTTWSAVQDAVLSTRSGVKVLFVSDNGTISDCSVRENNFVAGSVA